MSPGLYFLGLPWQHTRGSALLGWVKDDAEHIAERIDALPAGADGRPRTASLTLSDETGSRRTPRVCPRRLRPEIVELADGDTFELRIAPVAKRLGDATVRMLGLQRLDPRPDAARCRRARRSS